ncbi:MAG: Uma2 family endonuclease [Gemmataceae bacterium]|nr:Uma2 family endonuclease [Gemmataceae bacterium]
MNTVAEVRLLTAEEFAELPDDGRKMELVRGRIVVLNMPFPRHGEICSNIVHLGRSFLDVHDLGRIICNDSGVITERDPDSVRGMDVAFYSYAQIPKGPLPQGYLKVVPDVIFEVRSTSDRWPKILTKMAEYLSAGVSVVCILDQITESIHVYQPDVPVRVFRSDEILELPGPLHEWSVPVQSFFA